MKEPRQSFYYKIHALEMALVALQNIVARPYDGRGLQLTSTGYATLLEAARLGMIEIYKDHSILEKMNYPLP